MRISIVIACLNGGAVLARCLDSIAGQTFTDIEVIVADGASTDGSTKILRRYSETFGAALVWFSEPDRGIADAWNKAVLRATGDWLLFIGSDDTLAAPTVIAEAVSHLALADENSRIAYGRVLLVDEAGRVQEILGRAWSARNFRSCRFNLPHQGVFHRRAMFEGGARFDTSYSIVSDFDFLLRELMFAEPMDIGDLVVCRMRVGGISNRPQRAPRGIAEQIRLYRRHVGGMSPILYWDMVKAWIKVALWLLGGDALVSWARSIYRGRTLRAIRPPVRKES